jgi:two-component system, chemotaxis family, sensor kinase CheA
MTDEAASEEFLEIFRDEANERLDHIVDTLLALETGRAGPDAVDSLFRDAHTIKGAAGMLGLDDVRELAHAVEDVLDSVRESGEFPTDLAEPLLRAADSLRRHVEGRGDGTTDLLEELAASRGRVGRDTVPAPLPGASDLPRPAAERRSIRVPAEKLDRLLDLVGETVLHRRRLEHTIGGERVEESVELSDELDSGERLLGELQETAIAMRTLPLASITGPFPRAVRDISAAVGTEVELVLSGAETELDRVILEGLSDAIAQLLRNAVAHGIGTPRERERAGKPRQGMVELKAEQRGRMVAIVVSDDGKGVPEDVMRRARAEGESLVDVLTAPGFSTSSGVTELSGRGVGLHAVRDEVEAFGGTMDIESFPGKGTRVTLLLPLTLALLDVLLVERGGQVFGLPLPAVEEAVAVEETLSLAGRRSVELHGESLPLSDLADLVGAPASEAPSGPALVVSASGRRVAAQCDSLLGEEEVVVKSLGLLLAGLQGYLGASILGDGRIALLLDPAALVRPGGRKAQPREFPFVRQRVLAPKILVVEDSFTVRELQRSILEAAGYRVETAREGREALERISEDDEIALVVTDIEMPDVDGLELVRAVRADSRRASLPVIIVTTRGEEEDRRRGIAAGANAYMAKRSFDQQALLEKVAELVGA